MSIDTTAWEVILATGGLLVAVLLFVLAGGLVQHARRENRLLRWVRHDPHAAGRGKDSHRDIDQ